MTSNFNSNFPQVGQYPIMITPSSGFGVTSMDASGGIDTTPYTQDSYTGALPIPQSWAAAQMANINSLMSTLQSYVNIPVSKTPAGASALDYTGANAGVTSYEAGATGDTATGGTICFDDSNYGGLTDSGKTYTVPKGDSTVSLNNPSSLKGTIDLTKNDPGKHIVNIDTSSGTGNTLTIHGSGKDQIQLTDSGWTVTSSQNGTYVLTDSQGNQMTIKGVSRQNIGVVGADGTVTPLIPDPNSLFGTSTTPGGDAAVKGLTTTQQKSIQQYRDQGDYKTLSTADMSKVTTPDAQNYVATAFVQAYVFQNADPSSPIKASPVNSIKLTKGNIQQALSFAQSQTPQNAALVTALQALKPASADSNSPFSNLDGANGTNNTGTASQDFMNHVDQLNPGDIAKLNWDGEMSNNTAEQKYAAEEFVRKLVGKDTADATGSKPALTQADLDKVKQEASNTLANHKGLSNAVNALKTGSSDASGLPEDAITDSASMTKKLASAPVKITPDNIDLVDFSQIMQDPNKAATIIQNMDISGLSQPLKDRLAVELAANMTQAYAKANGVSTDCNLDDNNISANDLHAMRDAVKNLGPTGQEFGRILDEINSHRTSTARAAGKDTYDWADYLPKDCLPLLVQKMKADPNTDLGTLQNNN